MTVECVVPDKECVAVMFVGVTDDDKTIVLTTAIPKAELLAELPNLVQRYIEPACCRLRHELDAKRSGKERGLMLGGLGVYEIGIILLIAVILFGPRQLPKLGRALGETIKEFRGVGKEIERGTTDATDEA